MTDTIGVVWTIDSATREMFRLRTAIRQAIETARNSNFASDRERLGMVEFQLINALSEPMNVSD